MKAGVDSHRFHSAGPTPCAQSGVYQGHMQQTKLYRFLLTFFLHSPKTVQGRQDQRAGMLARGAAKQQRCSDSEIRQSTLARQIARMHGECDGPFTSAQAKFGDPSHKRPSAGRTLVFVHSRLPIKRTSELGLRVTPGSALDDAQVQ